MMPRESSFTREKKLELAPLLINRVKEEKGFFLNYSKKIHVNLHGMVVEYSCSPHAHFRAIPQFKNARTVNRPSEIRIDWVDYRDLLGETKPFLNVEWDGEVDSEVLIHKTNGALFCAQRDFLGMQVNSTHYRVVFDSENPDGYHNALRWILPEILIDRGKVIFHSAGVVDGEGFAHVFLGVSGAGKTTLSRKSRPRLVLGDDMVCVSIDSKGNSRENVFAETAAVGQNPQFEGPLQKRFPVRGLYFIHQSEEKFELTPLSSQKSAFLLFSSIPMASWEMLSEEKIARTLQFTAELAKRVPVYDLSYSLGQDPWELIDEKKGHTRS